MKRVVFRYDILDRVFYTVKGEKMSSIPYHNNTINILIAHDIKHN